MSDTLSERNRGRPSNAELAARAQAAADAGSALAKVESAEHPAATNDGGEDLARRRAERKPFGAFTQKLAYPVRTGYHRHVFNDDDGRIELAQQAGYTHVLKNGEPIKRVVGTAKAGGPLFGFLMEIPQEWYDEDMKREQDRVTEQDLAIRRGEMLKKDGQDGEERFYPTAQGRKINIDRR